MKQYRGIMISAITAVILLPSTYLTAEPMNRIVVIGVPLSAISPSFDETMRDTGAQATFMMGPDIKCYLYYDYDPRDPSTSINVEVLGSALPPPSGYHYSIVQTPMAGGSKTIAYFTVSDQTTHMAQVLQRLNHAGAFGKAQGTGGIIKLPNYTITAIDGHKQEAVHIFSANPGVTTLAREYLHSVSGK